MGFSLYWKEFYVLRVAQVGFAPSRVTSGSVSMKYSPGVTFSGEMPEDLVPC